MPQADLQGRPASDGLFAGPVLRINRHDECQRTQGPPPEEDAALSAALVAAMADIAALIDEVQGEAADILAFQLAMLEDDALAAPAREAIASGAAAETAWRLALDREAQNYAAAEDEYFQARAADIADIRDRVLRHLVGSTSGQAAGGMVLAGRDLAPTRFLETDWSHGGAIVLSAGSATSHVAMLARARGIPMVVGLGEISAADGDIMAVDGGAGRALLGLSPEELAHFDARAAALHRQRAGESVHLLQSAALRDGTPVEVLVNVAGVEELDFIDPRSCDGIGLMRSEFLFRDGAPLPDEETQYRAYCRMMEWAGGKPVTIRTLDIGGDKPVRGLTPAGESNPFLGLRGIRLTLARPDVFRTQLRALLRAAARGPLKVMLPMVTVREELDRSAALVESCLAELAGEGQTAVRPPLGIMIEVPAAALVPELFAGAAFFSIGSNDLVQYVTAAARDDAAVAGLNDAHHPAVAKLIAGVAAAGRSNNIPVSLCGDMASDPEHLRTLIGAGLRSLSVAPARLARVKAALAEI